MKSQIVFGALTVVGILAGGACYGTYRYWHPVPPRNREIAKYINTALKTDFI